MSRVLYLYCINSNVVHLERRTEHRPRIEVPAAQPLVASVPKVSRRVRCIVAPRLAARVARLRKEAVCAAHRQVENEVELLVEGSVLAAARPWIVAAEVTALVKSVTCWNRSDPLVVQAEADVIYVCTLRRPLVHITITNHIAHLPGVHSIWYR